MCLYLLVLNALVPSHCLCASASDLSGSERHFTHMKGAEACKTGPNNCTRTCAFDFWHTAAPATGFDGEYSAEVYGSETVRIIDEAAAAAQKVQGASDSNSTKPFFVYLAFANTHEREYQQTSSRCVFFQRFPF
eukprot:COSAG06_NODE_249_length_19140_cov_18.998004_16_plen_134_part_00